MIFVDSSFWIARAMPRDLAIRGSTIARPDLPHERLDDHRTSFSERRGRSCGGESHTLRAFGLLDAVRARPPSVQIRARRRGARARCLDIGSASTTSGRTRSWMRRASRSCAASNPRGARLRRRLRLPPASSSSALEHSTQLCVTHSRVTQPCVPRSSVFSSCRASSPPSASARSLSSSTSSRRSSTSTPTSRSSCAPSSRRSRRWVTSTSAASATCSSGSSTTKTSPSGAARSRCSST